jgi:hypothetical protein
VYVKVTLVPKEKVADIKMRKELSKKISKAVLDWIAKYKINMH